MIFVCLIFGLFDAVGLAPQGSAWITVQDVYPDTDSSDIGDPNSLTTTMTKFEAVQSLTTAAEVA